MTIRKVFFCFCAIFLFSCAFADLQTDQVAIDSRIKTFIYTSNQVFKIDANYGYQSFIEFADQERIKTVAIGDAVSWNVSPAGNRIFLRPSEKTGKTNMTVITDQRTYMFDLVARSDIEEMGDDLTYIARFFYPKAQNEVSKDYLQDDSFEYNANLYDIAYENLHQNYAVNGEDSISPKEVLDNSYVTFFKFKKDKFPRIFAVKKDKSETQLEMFRFKNYIVVKGVHKKLHLRYKDLLATVTNNDLL